MSREKLLIATSNRGKAKEIQKFLSSLPLEVYNLEDLRLEKSFLEDKKTFLENARGKSLFYSQFWPHLTLAEDSGLETEYLEGAPGVLSARFSDPRATDERNIQKVLKLMKDVPFDKRKARFVSALVLSRKGETLEEIVEHVEGYIAFEKKGNHGFGYDPIFFYPPLRKTFAELLPEEKNEVSHRGRALKKLKEFLSRYKRLASNLD